MRSGSRRLQIVGLSAVVIFAAALRLWQLSDVPNGFHGDEAVLGLEAQRIWRENGIGLYTDAALGQPTAPIYLTALSLRVFGDTIFAVRFVSVVMSVLTVVALYFWARRFFGEKVALLSAFILAFCNWHLHFSRVGFPLASWPLFTILGAWILLEATEKRQTKWWFAAGAALCSGIYIYNAHLLFLVVCTLFAVAMIWRDKATTLRARLSYIYALGGALLITPLPFVISLRRIHNPYSSHFDLFWLFSRAEWVNASMGMQIGTLIGRYLEFWEHLCWHPKVDGADGTGILTPMPLFIVLLAFCGAWQACKKWRAGDGNVAALLLVVLLLALPLGSVITVDGALRRTFALAPIVALLAACGAKELFRIAARWRPRWSLRFRLAFAGILLLLSAQSARDYFIRYPQIEQEGWAFVTGVTQAALWMQNLPPTAHVYFMSDRWSAEYETRRFLAPKVWIEDRSRESGVFSLDDDDRDIDSIWMLMDSYQPQLPKIRRLHPGGELIEGPPLPGTDKKCFLAYRFRKSP